MDLKNNQWDLADKDLTIWLNEDKHENRLPLFDILKSTYLTFRQKQIDRFSHFCNQAFEYYQEQERLKIQLIHEPRFEDNQIMFRKESLSESEEKARTQRGNQRIINGILTGDHKIFNELYEYEFPKVVKLIIKNSGSVDIAKDVFQDAIVILMEKVYANTLDLTCTISTYLYSICRFLWMDQLRQNKREMPFNDSYSYLNVEITVAGFENTPDIYENVNKAIGTLGDPCKQLLECYYYKNLSWVEIAQTLGYANAASARNQKYKCLERIRKTVNVEVG